MKVQISSQSTSSVCAEAMDIKISLLEDEEWPITRRKREPLIIRPESPNRDANITATGYGHVFAPLGSIATVEAWLDVLYFQTCPPRIPLVFVQTREMRLLGAKVTKCGDLTLVTSQRVLTCRSILNMPNHIAMEFKSTFLLDIQQRKTIRQLALDGDEIPDFLGLLVDPALAGCQVWLVDLGQQRTKAAAAEDRTFSFEDKCYVEVKTHMDLEPKDPTDSWSASAFVFIEEISKKLPMLSMEKVGVLIAE